MLEHFKKVQNKIIPSLSTFALINASVFTGIVGAQSQATVEEIVVTARKRSESLQDVPLSVSAIKEEDLEERGINVFEDYYNDYGILIVLGAGFTPFPFKFITIASGVFNLNIFLFIITAIIARGLRFYLLAGLLFVFGEKIKVLIEKYFNILAILFFILLIGSVLLIKFI